MKNIVKTLLICWLVVVANVGDDFTRHSKHYFSQSLMYCGKPNASTFSISSSLTGVNLFYPISTTTFILRGDTFKVLEVTPEQITVEIPD